MPDNEKAQAAGIPKSGEMIKAKTGIEYNDYSDDQTLGQTKEKPYNGMEATAAFELKHPNMKSVGNEQLIEQAIIRQKAVDHDIPAELAGETLSGLKAVPMVDGKVKVGALFMSHVPSKKDVIAHDKSLPHPASQEKIEGDLQKRDALIQLLKDPDWKVAKGLSNLTNLARDAETNINGHHLTDKQESVIRTGLASEQKLEHDMVTGHSSSPLNPVAWLKRKHAEHQVDKLMDTSATIAGIKLDDPVYEQYRKAMDKGIDGGLTANEGLQAIRKSLQQAGVSPARSDSGMATHAPAPKRELQARAPQ